MTRAQQTPGSGKMDPCSKIYLLSWSSCSIVSLSWAGIKAITNVVMSTSQPKLRPIGPVINAVSIYVLRHFKMRHFLLKHPTSVPGVSAGPEQLDHVGVVQVPHQAVLGHQVRQVRGGGGAGPEHLNGNLNIIWSSSWSLIL